MTSKLTRTLVAMALAAVLLGCGRRGDPEEEGRGAAAVPNVTVAKVERGAIAENLMVSGNLAAAPNRDAKLAALVPGRIARVLVVEGDAVKERQPVAELEDTLLREQERQAEAAVAQARASAQNARVAAEREEGLLGRGISSRKDVEDARTQLAVNTATLRQAEAGLATAKAQLERAVVRAPFAGTVVKRFAGVGEQVDGTAAQPIVEIAQVGTLELMGTVPAGLLSEIRHGETFTFESNAVHGAKLTARVVAVLPAVDPATNNGTVRIAIDNSQRRLKLGEYLSVNLPLRHGGPRLVVPRQAIYPDESGAPHVYKVSGEEAEFVPVQLGIQTGEKAEILSGVREGDIVIASGGYGLPERSKVHVQR